ncbi:MAG: helix-turn-helix transcriptional regulator [Myxococcales bacterium]|nr:helix-turn-helix transcriptional regulator [Myxococcales bacterium]
MARRDSEPRVLRLGLGRLAALSLPASKPEQVAALSPAEREVVRLALGGFGNGEIAELRQTSLRTVANQLASAYKKLGVSGRSELANKLAE